MRVVLGNHRFPARMNANLGSTTLGVFFSERKKSPRRELNSGPAAYEAAAIATKPRRRFDDSDFRTLERSETFFARLLRTMAH